MTYQESLSGIGAAADAEVASLLAQIASMRAAHADEVALLEARIAALEAQEPSDPPPVVDPPPAPSQPLPYTPPTGWKSFTPLVIPASGGSFTLDNSKDYLITANATVTGPITLTGGRNRVVMGLRLGGRKSQPSGSYDSTNRGIRLYDGADVGHDYIEGLYGEAGSFFSDLIQVAHRSNNGRTVTVQNVRLDGTTFGSKATVHADVIQCWGGPRTLRVHNLTARNVTYQGFYMDPADGRALPTGPGSAWSFSNINIEGTSTCKYLFADREPGFTKATASEVYISGSPLNNADSFGNAPSGVKVGKPSTDFAPASLWASAYVSPWS